MNLKWLPIPPHFWIPDEFRDYEVGWHVNLLKASLRTETPGYLQILHDGEEASCAEGLSVTRDLWKLAGSHNGPYFQKESVRVMARFEVRQFGCHRVLFFPPLVEVINEQLKKLRNKRSRPEISEASTGVHRGSGFSSPSLFDFDVGSKKEMEAKKPNQFTQADFDARDLRKLNKAYEVLERIQSASLGSGRRLTDREVFEWVCARAGISVKRGLQIEKLQKEWPKEGAG